MPWALQADVSVRQRSVDAHQPRFTANKCLGLSRIKVDTCKEVNWAVSPKADASLDRWHEPSAAQRERVGAHWSWKGRD